MAGSGLPPAGPNRGRGASAITTHHATTGPPQSAHTRRAYAADWQAFAAWCAAAGQPAQPATPEAVAGHLASLAGRLGPSGLRRRLAAIADRHRRAGHPWDPAQPAIRATLRRLVAGPVAPARPAAVLDEAALRPLLAICGEDLAGQRDRALFLLVQASGLRRAALVALDREQLRFTAAGVVLEIGQDVLELARSPDSNRCSVRA
ncbi:MAG: hypothetical protein EON47_24460, partial [Acetobacteraceae bacterium]